MIPAELEQLNQLIPLCLPNAELYIFCIVEIVLWFNIRIVQDLEINQSELRGIECKTTKIGSALHRHQL